MIFFETTLFFIVIHDALFKIRARDPRGPPEPVPDESIELVQRTPQGVYIVGKESKRETQVDRLIY